MNWTTRRGEPSTPHPAPTEPPRRRAPTRRGPGTYANERPPIRSVIARETGAPRVWVGDHADTCTCHDLMAENVPVGRPSLDTDAWQGDHGSHPAHAWARDDAGDGVREVHGNTCEGGGAALRPDLRAFRGVHQRSRHLSVATYEAMITTNRVTPQLSRRMCLADLSEHTGDT